MAPFNFNIRLRTLARRRGAESETGQFGRDARRDWQLLFVVFILFNLISVVFNLFVYERINKGEIFLVDKPGPPAQSTLNRFELEKTAAFFEEKRRKFESLKGAGFIIPDPGPATAPKR